MYIISAGLDPHNEIEAHRIQHNRSLYLKLNILNANVSSSLSPKNCFNDLPSAELQYASSGITYT
jgi:hypothetical protein